MARFLLFLLSLSAGLAVITLGLVAPAHFRATDARTVAAAQGKSLSVMEAGLALARQGKIGAARSLLAFAQQEQLAGAETLEVAIEQHRKAHPELAALGRPDPVAAPILLAETAAPTNRQVLDLLLVDAVRERALKNLYQSSLPAVSRLLATRTLTNLAHFSPVNSSAGKPLDAVIALTALLARGEHFAPPLRDHLEWLAKQAYWEGQTKDLELVYLDLLVLGKRMDWGQLTEFIGKITNAATLRTLAANAAEQEDRLPGLFAAAHLAGDPGAVAKYLDLKQTRGTSLADLEYSLRYGEGGLRLLLASQKRLYHPREQLIARLHLERISTLAANLALHSRWMVLALKLLLLFDGAYLLALAGTYLLPAEASGRRLVSPAQLALTAALLGLILVWSEPFLLQQSQKVEMPLHWKLPVLEGPLRAAIQQKMSPMVDSLSLASLTFFMMIQVAIFVFCRRKLAEIQRQPLPEKLKLKLLENEEHLFDAGLYFGFVGTVLSLMFVSVGIIKFSLMAAYSSTSFGIIFVSVLKIFYVRPYRKQLILEVESAAAPTPVQ